MARFHRSPNRFSYVLVAVGALLSAPAWAETKAKEPLVRLRLSGYVQADAVPFRQSSLDEVNSATGEPLNEDRFTITRARLRADARASILSGAIEMDANTVEGPVARVIEAELSARWQGADKDAPPYAMATLGLFKIPFGVEGPEPERRRRRIA